MEFLRHRPLLCAAAGFAAGIGAWAAGLHSLPLALACAILGLALLCAPRPTLVVAGLFIAGLGLGALRLSLFQTRAPGDIARWVDTAAPVVVVGTVASDPERRTGHISLTLRAERIETRGQTYPAAGYSAVTLPDMPRAPDYGDRLSLNGLLETPPRATNPGAFSWRDQLARRGVYAWLRVPRPQSVQMLGPGQTNPLLALAWHVRHRVTDSISRSLPPEQAAVLGGILIGQRAALPPDLLGDFARTGTVHILASAGLHVGILALCLLALCRLLTLPRIYDSVLIIPMLALYAIVCGGRPSVTRAVVVAIVYFGAGLCGRTPDGPTTLAAAALFILTLQPTALLESGFQLSFLTVLTLALLMPLWSAWWEPILVRRVRRGPARTVATHALDLCGLAIVAQMGALPLVARDTNLVSLLSIPANLLVVPLLFLLIPLGFAATLVTTLWPGGGALLLWPCHSMLTWIITVVRACAAPDWATVAVPAPAPAVIVLYYASLIGVAWWLRRTTARPTEPPVSPAPAFF